jgi:hypothetical protein
MRRFPLLVLLTGVLASLPGLSLPARTAVAAPPTKSCRQKFNDCLNGAYAQLIACQNAGRPGCYENYEASILVCESNFRICLISGN